jgi:hypothetical protein
MLRYVALVRSDVFEEHSASIIKVTRIGELGTTLDVTSKPTYFFAACLLLHIGRPFWREEEPAFFSVHLSLVRGPATIYCCLIWDFLNLVAQFPLFLSHKEQGGPVIPPGPGFLFRNLLRHSGLQRSYCSELFLSPFLMSRWAELLGDIAHNSSFSALPPMCVVLPPNMSQLYFEDGSLIIPTFSRNTSQYPITEQGAALMTCLEELWYISQLRNSHFSFNSFAFIMCMKVHYWNVFGANFFASHSSIYSWRGYSAGTYYTWISKGDVWMKKVHIYVTEMCERNTDIE